MQPQANYAHKHSPEDNEKVAAEGVGSSGNGDAREEVVSDESNAFLVTFGSEDAENPLNWSTKLKWGVTAAVSGTGFNRIMVSTVRHSLCRKRVLYQEGDNSFEAWGIC